MHDRIDSDNLKTAIKKYKCITQHILHKTTVYRKNELVFTLMCCVM